jgi:hypothetical protein
MVKMMAKEESDIATALFQKLLNIDTQQKR